MRPNQYWCIGRNFSDHALELGNPIPEKPLIFLKSGGCLQTGTELVFPEFCREIHHEIEIVLLLGEKLKPTHWTLGLDFTERKIQNELKQLGQPWELSKSFKGAAALGPWQELKNLNDLSDVDFTLTINGFQKQHGHVSQMIFKFDKLIQYLADRFPLAPGDAIFTGTPAGVGAIHSDDVLEAQCGSLKIQWKVK
jgi:2-keto-4-pentenoate hydratase/2-oxohepta-3-ene-1,7-dioic acid hydratase in catechol pathway